VTCICQPSSSTTQIEPYQTTPNSVVMSENGNTPVWFKGFHQTDIIRAKA